MQCVSGRVPANYWIHCKHLTIGKKKMSKRTGNVLYVKELAKCDVPSECLRYYLISEKYRNKLDFTTERFKQEICRVHEMIEIFERVGDFGSRSESFDARVYNRIITEFEDAMNNDLNTKLAFRRVFRELLNAEKELNLGKMSREKAKGISSAIEKIDKVFGIFVS